MLKYSQQWLVCFRSPPNVYWLDKVDEEELCSFTFFTFCFLGSKGLKSLFCFFSSFEGTEDNLFKVLHGGVGDTAGAGKKILAYFILGFSRPRQGMIAQVFPASSCCEWYSSLDSKVRGDWKVEVAFNSAQMASILHISDGARDTEACHSIVVLLTKWHLHILEITIATWEVNRHLPVYGK